MEVDRVMQRGMLERQLGTFGASLVVLAFVFAVTGIPAWIPSGAIVAVGVPSPLSGMTRSFVALASGDVAGAFDWHPLGPVLFLACVAATILGGWATITRRPAVRLRNTLSARWTWILAAVLLVGGWIRQLLVFG